MTRVAALVAFVVAAGLTVGIVGYDPQREPWGFYAVMTALWFCVVFTLTLGLLTGLRWVINLFRADRCGEREER